MGKSSVDYKKIDEYLSGRRGKVVTAAGIANGIGVERIYGATMSKLVRDGSITPYSLKGYYRAN